MKLFFTKRESHHSQITKGPTTKKRRERGHLGTEIRDVCVCVDLSTRRHPASVPWRLVHVSYTSMNKTKSRISIYYVTSRHTYVYMIPYVVLSRGQKNGKIMRGKKVRVCFALTHHEPTHSGELSGWVDLAAVHCAHCTQQQHHHHNNHHHQQQR